MRDREGSYHLIYLTPGPQQQNNNCTNAHLFLLFTAFPQHLGKKLSFRFQCSLSLASTISIHSPCAALNGMISVPTSSATFLQSFWVAEGRVLIFMVKLAWGLISNPQAPCILGLWLLISRWNSRASKCLRDSWESGRHSINIYGAGNPEPEKATLFWVPHVC